MFLRLCLVVVALLVVESGNGQVVSVPASSFGPTTSTVEDFEDLFPGQPVIVVQAGAQLPSGVTFQGPMPAQIFEPSTFPAPIVIPAAGGQIDDTTTLPSPTTILLMNFPGTTGFQLPISVDAVGLSFEVGTLEMRAYDASGALLGSVTATGDGLADNAVDGFIGLATVSGAATIDRIELVGTSYVIDDLVFNGVIGPSTGDFIRGDCTGDGSVNIADAISLLGILFPQGPPMPVDCRDACDADDMGGLNVADAIVLLNSLFGAAPVPLPEPLSCGSDPTTTDTLDCLVFGPCP